MEESNTRYWMHALIAFGVLAALGCGIAMKVISSQKGVLVRIENTDTEALWNIHLTCRGGSYDVAVLQPNQKTQLFVEPTGPSDLTIEFVDGAKAKFSKTMDVTMTHESSGGIDVQISRGNVAEWKSYVR